MAVSASIAMAWSSLVVLFDFKFQIQIKLHPRTLRVVRDTCIKHDY